MIMNHSSRCPDRIFVMVVAAIAALMIPGTLAGTIEADDARIVEVTVFPDRAEVVREVTLAVPAGASTVEFPGLPLNIETDSLRVSAAGVPATLGAVELMKRARQPEVTPEHRAAKEEVRRLEAAMATLDTAESTAGEVRDLVTSIRAATAKRESQRLAEGALDPASLREMIQVVRTNLETLDREKLGRIEERYRLARDLEVARARLAATRPAGTIHSRLASVEIAAERAGNLRLRLAYLARGAS